MMNLKSLITPPLPVTVTPPMPMLGAYVEGWWGSPSHTGATYKSNNAATVSKQADLMQAVGVEMVNHTFYGTRETVILESARLWAAETAKRGMLFSIMVVNDMFAGITTDKTVYLADQLMKCADLFTTPSYIPERVIWDFGVIGQVDEAKLRSLTSSLGIKEYWREHDDFTWVNAPGTRTEQVTYEKAQRNNGRLKAPSIWYQFNDQSVSDPTKSVWGGPARRLDGERGNLFIDLCRLPMPATAKYIMLGTWDDYEEGTAIEGMLAASVGIQIV